MWWGFGVRGGSFAAAVTTRKSRNVPCNRRNFLSRSCQTCRFLVFNKKRRKKLNKTGNNSTPFTTAQKEREIHKKSPKYFDDFQQNGPFFLKRNQNCIHYEYLMNRRYSCPAAFRTFTKERGEILLRHLNKNKLPVKIELKFILTKYNSIKNIMVHNFTKLQDIDIAIFELRCKIFP